jgi:transcriptional regulator of acetoin/glycerol metabolism
MVVVKSAEPRTIELLVASGVEMSTWDLPAELREPAPRSTEGIPPDRPTLNELKRRYIRRVIEESGGNVTQAAAVLGVDRRSLYRMLQRHRIPWRGRAADAPEDSD